MPMPVFGETHRRVVPDGCLLLLEAQARTHGACSGPLWNSLTSRSLLILSGRTVLEAYEGFLASAEALCKVDQGFRYREPRV